MKLAQTHLLFHIYRPDRNIGKHVVHSYLLNSYFHNMVRFLLCFLEVAIRNGQTNCSILLNST